MLLLVLFKDAGFASLQVKRIFAGPTKKMRAQRPHAAAHRTLICRARPRRTVLTKPTRGTVFGFPESSAILCKPQWRVKRVDVENGRIGCAEVI
ncbi:MAG TPA: hypothetical protein VF634_11060 [Pyrinomonadaceae bacterium]